MAVRDGVLTQFEQWVCEKYGLAHGEMHVLKDSDFQEFAELLKKTYPYITQFLEPIDVREQPFNWQEVYT